MRIKSVLKQVFLTEEENKKLNDCMRKENIRNFSEFARQKLIRTDLNIQKVSFEGLVPLRVGTSRKEYQFYSPSCNFSWENKL